MNNCNFGCYGCDYAGSCAAYGAAPTGSPGMDIQQGESNLPISPEISLIGDAHLDSRLRRPPDWRWRMPELDAVKKENAMINPGSRYNEFTLDSFAAFGQDTSISPAADTSNVFTNAISGILTQITPAAQAAVQRAVGGTPHPTSLPAAKSSGIAALTGSGKPSTGAIVLIGAVAVGAILLLTMKK